ncbi:MAG: dethiobiotin synthase [Bacteroidetes bacterium]|nr:dethiobiotin synthase [Bacteroidota bacterium]
MQPIFITGIGTGIGKTLVSAIVTEALGASYWKPVQAGFDEGTDSQWVGERTAGARRIPEVYKLKMPASPHIAAREEGVVIDLDRIAAAMPADRPLVIEGAGGLLVPLNDREFVLDLVRRLDATVILVSRNYLGSINHSLLTAEVCRSHGLRVAGWIFNDQYLAYEEEIVAWSGIPAIGSIPFGEPGVEFVRMQAKLIGPALRKAVSL